MRVLLMLVFGALCHSSFAPPTPPLFPMQFSINFSSTVFELGQVGNGTLFYNYVQNPTEDDVSWQVVHNDLCPTGDVTAPCRYVFFDDGKKAEFWVVTSNFCCLAVDTGPVIPGVLKSWLYWGTFEILGQVCDNYYSLEGGANNLNSFSVRRSDQSFVAMSRAGPGAFSATLLWKFTSGFTLGSQDPKLRELPSFCKGPCPSK